MVKYIIVFATIAVYIGIRVYRIHDHYYWRSGANPNIEAYIIQEHLSPKTDGYHGVLFFQEKNVVIFSDGFVYVTYQRYSAKTARNIHRIAVNEWKAKH